MRWVGYQCWRGPNNRYVWLIVITRDGCACRAQCHFGRGNFKLFAPSDVPVFHILSGSALSCAMLALHRKSLRWTRASETAFVRLRPLTDVSVEKIGVLSERPRPFSRGDSDRRFSQSAGCASVPDSPLPFDGGTSLRHFRVRERWK